MRVRRPRSIYDDTPLIPEAVADSVIGEVEACFGPVRAGARELSDRLVQRAEHIYAKNERFAKKIRGRSGRDYLWSFMRHWLSGALMDDGDPIAQRLPQDFKVGHQLRCPK